MKRGVTVLFWVASVGCNSGSETGLTRFDFAASTRSPRGLSVEEIDHAARVGLHDDEWLDSVATYSARGIGHTIVQVVSESPTNTRAYVVDEDGQVTETQVFWASSARPACTGSAS